MRASSHVAEVIIAILPVIEPRRGDTPSGFAELLTQAGGRGFGGWGAAQPSEVNNAQSSFKAGLARSVQCSADMQPFPSWR
jgi:hypothetical protein